MLKLPPLIVTADMYELATEDDTCRVFVAGRTHVALHRRDGWWHLVDAAEDVKPTLPRGPWPTPETAAVATIAAWHASWPIGEEDTWAVAPNMSSATPWDFAAVLSGWVLTDDFEVGDEKAEVLAWMIRVWATSGAGSYVNRVRDHARYYNHHGSDDQRRAWGQLDSAIASCAAASRLASTVVSRMAPTETATRELNELEALTGAIREVARVERRLAFPN